MISYDPDKVPQVDARISAEAKSYGFQPVYIVCDEPGAVVGEHAGVSFVAFTNFIPRVGDRIGLEDGTIGQVEHVEFRLVKTGVGKNVPILVPNVYAIRISS